MSAAIILCAGKGTRMNDDSISKVCFPCAGIPVIKRIVDNYRQGGVDTFVVVVGHNAESVKATLAGEENVVYAYQTEQKGTGHAAKVGLDKLKELGYRGEAVVTMGDKIISPSVIRGLLSMKDGAKAVWSVQPLRDNYNGGRVVVESGEPYGVVEFADAALAFVAGIPENERRDALMKLGLNEKKAQKVLEKASLGNASPTIRLRGREFTAEEVLNTKYANAGLYCFDVDAALAAIGKCGSSNAQGEIYLTDTLEIFANDNSSVIYEITDKNDMLTYSTKNELREISKAFYRSARQYAKDIEDGELDSSLSALYDDLDGAKKRYSHLLNAFSEKYGDRKVVITHSPGRVNLMGRHIDHRGGGINVMTINRDIIAAASPREDDRVNVCFLDSGYSDSFTVSESLSLAPYNNWLDYLEAKDVKEALKASGGSPTNYVKSAFLRLQVNSNTKLCGMDIVISGSVPMAAGLSSSSAIVVAMSEAVVFLNNLNLTDKEFVELCGEAEWFVGSRGGAGDHAAMKCCKKGKITHLSFKPFRVETAMPFSDEYVLIIANSMQMAKKSEGSKDKFNAKVAAYEVALMLLNKDYPQYSFKEFRDIAKEEEEAIYEMILSLPEKMTREEIFAELKDNDMKLERIFSSHKDPGTYDIRGVALYGVTECIRSRKVIDTLNEGDYRLLGDMMKVSHLGDSVTRPMSVDGKTVSELKRMKTPLYMVAGAYGCSTERIDYLVSSLDSYDGVLGTSLVGAGLGGCVIAVVERAKSAEVLEKIKNDYYRRFGLEESVDVYTSSQGSGVIL